ncbi:MAG: IclR family transcriptional regulator [Armatimonadota bacterium]|nr:IclR family transcriptional regulator [Armatimonadota bacterium]
MQKVRRVPAVDRAIQLLKLLKGSEMRLTELCRRTGLHKSTVHGILHTLEAHGFVSRNPATKRYRLSYGLLELGNAVLAWMDLRRIARGAMEELWRKTGETVVLHLLDRQGSLIIDREESPHELRVAAPIGKRLPPFAGAVYKVFLAGLPDEELERLLKNTRLPRFTSRSITDPQAYLREVRRARKLGYALDDEEYLPAVRAASAAICDPEGTPVASLSVVGVSVRMDNKRLREIGELVREASQKVSELLRIQEGDGRSEVSSPRRGAGKNGDAKARAPSCERPGP